MWLGWYTLIPFGILFAITMFWALKVEKLKKENDIQTYKEIVAFTEDERTEYIHTIIDEASRFTTLATNILNLSKVEQQSILTNQNRFNVTKQLRQVIALLDKKWSDTFTKMKIIVAIFSCTCEYFPDNPLKFLLLKFAPKGSLHF